MPQTIEIEHPSAIHAARQLIKSMASSLGFDERAGEEITIAGSELASNLVQHAVAGRLIMTPLVEGSRTGIQIESIDNGPGIADPEQAIYDLPLTDIFRGVGRACRPTRGVVMALA